MSQVMYKGTVKWFNAVKGFGFIGSNNNTTDWPHEDKSKDIFVHYTGISDSGYKKLNDADEVEFCVEEGNGSRLQAIQVVNLTNDENKSAARSH